MGLAVPEKGYISRSVTSSPGMTAYMVILAQTRIGFLSGGRGQKFRDAQLEEAYARATVALTAHVRCVYFRPAGYERDHWCCYCHGQSYVWHKTFVDHHVM